MTSFRGKVFGSLLALSISSVGAVAFADGGESRECNCQRGDSHESHPHRSEHRREGGNKTDRHRHDSQSVVSSRGSRDLDRRAESVHADRPEGSGALTENRERRSSIRANEEQTFTFTLRDPAKVDIEVDFERNGNFTCELRRSNNQSIMTRETRGDDDCEFDDVRLEPGDYKIVVKADAHSSSRFSVEYDIDRD